MEQTFGSFLREKRMARGLTLRGMAAKLDLSPVYMSNIENDRRAAPSQEYLERMAMLLQLNKPEREWMLDLAAKSKQNRVSADLPDYIMDREIVRAALRTAREADATDQEWQDFIDRINQGMRTLYYREQALEGIAREVITAYDPNLYYGVPRMIPIEDIIEAQGITLEYQYLRKTGCVLGETIFDDGGAIIYDYDLPGYTVIKVKGGTILIDSSLCGEDVSTGRLRFTCAHELAHWLLHKKIYSGTGESAAMVTEQNITESQNNTLETQANLLGSILLMPLPQVKRCFYRLQPGRDRQQLIADMADVFQVSKQAMRIRLENHHLL